MMLKIQRTLAIITVILFMLAGENVSLAAEDANKQGESRSKELSQNLENFKRDVNEAWRTVTDSRTYEPVRREVNQAWSEITSAARTLARGEKTEKGKKDREDK